MTQLTAFTKLTELGITDEQIGLYDIIILPENTEGGLDEMRDAQDGITLSKLLKAEGLKCANSFDLNLNVPTVERRSNDLWLGVIYLMNEGVIPTAVSVMANIITPLIQHKKEKTDARTPTGGIHTEITIKKEEGFTKIKYDGDAETFLKILESLKK